MHVVITMMKYLIGLSIAVNQLANAASGGTSDETISSRLGLAREHGSKVGSALCAMLNVIDHRHEVAGEDHCTKAIRHQRERRTARSVAALALIDVTRPVFADQGWEVNGDQLAPNLIKLERWATKHGISVTREDLSAFGLAGLTMEREVTLDPSLSPNAQFATLVHELTHVYLSTDDTAENEVLAETVAVQVCAKLGLSTLPQTSAYLGSKSSTLDLWRATFYARDLDKLVALFVKESR